ncbi:MAG TPA: hypothetical protein VLM41_01630 [Steroidobacteraceae bacterium]|nr:hypothetical protein [Steroidobacteraceae bacterium]
MIVRLVATVLILAAGAWAPHALGDTRQADCEVSKDGNRWKGASGLCSISQRQGHVTIRLRNGDSYELRPSHSANHFRDQRNNKVVRSSTGDGQQFRWEGGKKIQLRWTGGYGKPSQQPGGPVGRTPHNLRDLVGARSAQAMNEMWRRGYELRGGGSSPYGVWRERTTSRCVRTHVENGRLRSAVYAPEADCRR